MNNLSDLGKLFLRVSFSVLMLPHGWSKVNRLFEDDIKFSDPIGIGIIPSLILVAIAEFVAPILIILGFKTRWIALFPITAMTVATFVSNLNKPFGQMEKGLLFLAAFVAIALIGPGKYSIDKR